MKSKRISSLLVAAIATSLIMTSCEDEVLVPVEDKTKVEALLNGIDTSSTALLKVNMANNTLLLHNEELETQIAKLNSNNQSASATKVQYTVNILSASSTIFGSNGSGNENIRLLRTSGVAGVAGVSIRLEQNGKSITATTTESGIAIFDGLKSGYANVFVSGAEINHTDVEYSVYLGNGETGEEILNAASQVVLLPTSGDKSATIKGMAMINLRSDDDTLGRRYADSYAVTALAGKYLSTPFRIGLQNWNVGGTIFESSLSSSTKMSYNPAAGKVVYAYPLLPESAINNSTERGYITRISYKGAIVKTTVATDGSYSLNVPTSTLGLDIKVETENVVDSHTRLTQSAANSGQSVGADLSGDNTATPSNYETAQSTDRGTANELGSVVVDYKNITGRTNTSQVTSTTVTSVKRRTITEKYYYYPSYSNENGGNSYWGNHTYRYSKPGMIINMNIYLDPNYRY